GRTPLGSGRSGGPPGRPARARKTRSSLLQPAVSAAPRHHTRRNRCSVLALRPQQRALELAFTPRFEAYPAAFNPIEYARHDSRNEEEVTEADLGLDSGRVSGEDR